MAAQDYYASFTPQHQQQQQQSTFQRPAFKQSPHNSFSQSFAPSISPYNNELAPYIPPQSSQYSQSPLQQNHIAPPYPEQGSPRILTPQPLAQQYRPQHQQQQLHYQSNQSQLGPPLAPQRSYSSPADPRHVHFSEARGRRSASVYSSDSDSDSDSRSRSRSHSRREERRQSRRQSNDDRERKRDTFLGAGGGALIGDAIFPGAGTLGGLLLGGLGGRQYARRRTRSELPPRRDSRDEHEHHEHHEHERRYRDGITVKSGLIRR